MLNLLTATIQGSGYKLFVKWRRYPGGPVRTLSAIWRRYLGAQLETKWPALHIGPLSKLEKKSFFL